ncbi:hypothetical protein MHUMG1_06560 [Metarhizium humberi]|uniref:Uncharacterized protein n=1 Tax=Metarhizium humberi TaxID=2596975 RepID=A0A9P8M7V7_9HYPO|nr:hypothetical protein MHUMG1_06560 [Metarhizium humberi]
MCLSNLFSRKQKQDANQETQLQPSPPAQVTGRRTAAATALLRNSKFASDGSRTRYSSEKQTGAGYSPSGYTASTAIPDGQYDGIYGAVHGAVYSEVSGGANGGVSGRVYGGVYGTSSGGGLGTAAGGAYGSLL